MKIGSLVAYKGKPAKVIEIIGNKYLISVSKDKLKVREKDIRFINEKYEELVELEADFSILEDFYEQTLSLDELTQWLFTENSPSASWQTFLLVEDSLYFYWRKKDVFVRPIEQVEKIKEDREQKILYEKRQSSFIKRVEQKTWHKDDLEFLYDIEKVAFNQSKHSQALKNLNLKSTPEVAHQLLIDIGYWSLKQHPYFQRNKIELDDIDVEITNNSVARLDLTHLKSYAIDNEDSTDADDALSIDGDKVWVHITDVAGFINKQIDEYAKNRGSTIYTPDTIITMLPSNVLKSLSLGGETSNTISIGFKFIDNQISDIEVVQAIIKTINISYDEVDVKITTNDFEKLNNIAIKHYEFRQNEGAVSLNLPKINLEYKNDTVIITAEKNSQARKMVAEFMVMAGHVISIFAQDKKIAMPFLSQGENDFKKIEQATLSEQFEMARNFPKSKTSPEVSSHSGLGLKSYIRITSPLRRYMDLVAQQQLLAFLNNKTPLMADELKQIIHFDNKALSKVRKVSREVINHTKLLYLKQQKNKKYSAIVIGNSKKIIFCIESLAIVNEIKTKKSFKLDEKIIVKVQEIDIVNSVVEWSICDND
ncbi:RNase R-related protein [hydrothermal vent metagenome]|uniref:RNase R-related protein n=1 Tax=hydrothermal vent metagenome TaxID=652676 RepID=A0A1W1CI07_9ZZZZ